MTQRKWVPDDAYVRASWGSDPEVTHLWNYEQETQSWAVRQNPSANVPNPYEMLVPWMHTSLPRFKAGFLSLPKLTLNLAEATAYTWPGIAVLLCLLQRQSLPWDLIPYLPTPPHPTPTLPSERCPLRQLLRQCHETSFSSTERWDPEPHPWQPGASWGGGRQGFPTYCPSRALHSRECCQHHKSLACHHAGWPWLCQHRKPVS